MRYRDFKYIIIDEYMPRICSGAENHEQLAGGLNVTSAGFAQIEIVNTPEGPGARVKAYGRSISLNKDSKPEDSETLTRFLCS